jgi:deferrochelatase/peroxidase EfeB
MREPQTAANPWAPLDLALVPEGVPDRYGTFVVMRKLLQDVDGWKQAVETVTSRRTGGSVTPDEIALTGAMAVGRFQDGTPVVSHGSPIAADDPENDFTYSEDPFGARCPAYAHIRKTNPRSGAKFESLEQERRHRIARRGMPLVDDAGDAIGLMFVCLQSDIAQQFEFIERVWAGSPDFPFSGTGRDLIAGRRGAAGPPDVDRRWPAHWGAGGSRIPFGQFVQFAGGAYLYAPSMAALREIASGP